MWSDGRGPVYVGKLEVRGDGLHLRGSAAGELAHARVSSGDLARVQVVRVGGERINDLTTVVLSLRGGDAIRVAALDGAGALFEIADLAADLAVRRDVAASTVVVRVPIRGGRRERVCELVRDGPPFDPAAVAGLERHHVFVGDHDVVFIFEGRDVKRAIERLLGSPSVWMAAAAWKDCIAGRPTLIDPHYSWERPSLS